jgi:hypothetical protein
MIANCTSTTKFFEDIRFAFVSSLFLAKVFYRTATVIAWNGQLQKRTTFHEGASVKIGLAVFLTLLTHHIKFNKVGTFFGW